MRLKTILESLVFASDKPISLKQLKALTNTTKGEKITELLEDIKGEFRDSGIQLVSVGGGWQFRTNPENAKWVRKLLAGRPPRLTRAMLETLSIIAYRQPVTRPEIEDIRGVDCGGVLRILLERGLIRIMGKKEEVGRPLLYGTTQQFLEFFNLKELKELPTLKEFTELTEEHADKVDLEYGDGEEPAEGEEPPELPLAEGTQPQPEEEEEVEQAAATDGPQPQQTAYDPDTGGFLPVPSPDPADAPHLASITELRPSPSADSFPRRIPIVDEEDEDGEAALAALDRALERVETVLKAPKKPEEPAEGDGEGAPPSEGAEPVDAEAGAPSDPTSDPKLDPTSDPTLDPTPDPALDPTPDPTSDPAPEPDSEPVLELDPETDFDPDVEPDPEPDFDPDVEPDPEPDFDPDVEPDPEPEEPSRG